MRPSTQASADPGAPVPLDPPDPNAQAGPAVGLVSGPGQQARCPRPPAIRAPRQARCERAGTNTVLTREIGASETTPLLLVLRAPDGRTVHTESPFPSDHDLLLSHSQGIGRQDVEDLPPGLGGVPTDNGGAPPGFGGDPRLRHRAAPGRHPMLDPRGETTAWHGRREPRNDPADQPRDRRVHRTPEDAAPAGGVSSGRRAAAPIVPREESPVPPRPVARGSVRTAGTRSSPASGRGTPSETSPRRSPVFRGLAWWEAGARV